MKGLHTHPRQSREELSDLLTGFRRLFRGSIRERAAVGSSTTFTVGGETDALFIPADEEDVALLIPWLARNRLAVLHVRPGANLLVDDNGFRGTMIDLRRACGTITYREAEEDARLVNAGAAARVGELVDFCVRHGIAGAEGFAGFAGSLGGALADKRGELAAPLREALHELRIVREGGILSLARSDALNLLSGPREKPWTILAATLRLRTGDTAELLRSRRAVLMQRITQDGGNIPGAAKVFYDESDSTASELLRRAGCEGIHAGNAIVMTSFPNVVGQRGRAVAGDIFKVIMEMRERVRNHTGRVLALRVRLAGFGMATAAVTS
jgi:UDP-N-acetylmuramate dehydrogenase